MRIQKLRPLHLTELYGTLSAKLAPRTIGHVHRGQMELGVNP
jgi:hypothetical protein